MFEITRIRTYSQYDLANLLVMCAEYLALAYQELAHRDLNRLSQEAYSAADFLSCMAAGQELNHQVH